MADSTACAISIGRGAATLCTMPARPAISASAPTSGPAALAPSCLVLPPTAVPPTPAAPGGPPAASGDCGDGSRGAPSYASAGRAFNQNRASAAALPVAPPQG